jgi:hypothetical protein
MTPPTREDQITTLKRQLRFHHHNFKILLSGRFRREELTGPRRAALQHAMSPSMVFFDVAERDLPLVTPPKWGRRRAAP